MGVVVRGKKESTINTLCLYPPTILLKGGGKGGALVERGGEISRKNYHPWGDAEMERV